MWEFLICSLLDLATFVLGLLVYIASMAYCETHILGVCDQLMN